MFSSLLGPRKLLYSSTVILRIVFRRNIVFKSPYTYIQPPKTLSFSEFLLQKLWHHGIKNPNKSALINAINPAETLTFKDVYLQSLSISTFLHSNNFHHGHVVALVLPNLIYYPSILIGTGLLGGATTPASTLLSVKELETQFNDSKASIIICADFVLEKVMEAVINSSKIKKIICIKTGSNAFEEKSVAENEEFRKKNGKIIDFDEIKNIEPNFHCWNQIEINPERDIFILPYSSGTTGPPKGVMISNNNLSIMVSNFSTIFKNNILSCIYNNNNSKDDGNNVIVNIEDDAPQLCFLPFNHALGSGIILNNLFMGISTIVMPQFNFEELCKNIEKFKTQIIFVVPPILLSFANNLIVDKYDLSSLKYVITAAAPIDKDLMEAVKKRLPNIQGILQGYGMTETAFLSHCNLPTEKYPNNSVGKLMPGFEMKIVDPETQKECDTINEKGEIYLRSQQNMIGYFNKPSSTAAIKDDEQWLKTGDIGYIDAQGYTYIVDRIKELIKVKGMQVAPAELEALLLTHPNILDAAVIGIPNSQYGEIPKAFIVVKEGSEIDENQIKEFVEISVAPYKQLKGGVELVKEIPKSPSGKILRRVLRESSNIKK